MHDERGPALRLELQSLLQALATAEARGVKGEVQAATEALVRAAGSREDRDELARHLLRGLRHPPRRRRIKVREPLRSAIIRPYISERIDDPAAILDLLLLQDSVQPLLLQRYVAFDQLTSSPTVGALKYALTRTDDPQVWRALVMHRLGEVAHGLHHIDEGLGTVDGSTANYVWVLADAVYLAASAPAGALDQSTVDDLKEQWQLLRDWVLYSALDRPSCDFAAWTQQRGSTHWVARGNFPVRVYYDRRTPG